MNCWWGLIRAWPWMIDHCHTYVLLMMTMIMIMVMTLFSMTYFLVIQFDLWNRTTPCPMSLHFFTIPHHTTLHYITAEMCELPFLYLFHARLWYYYTFQNQNVPYQAILHHITKAQVVGVMEKHKKESLHSTSDLQGLNHQWLPHHHHIQRIHRIHHHHHLNF